MSFEPAIVLKGVSKCYHSYKKPLDRLKQSFVRNRILYDEFWALQDIDLEVGQGETLGIVGQNGSGKSTLLQLVVGTLSPTEGEVRCQGRISAILELGAGFNPEFSGIENAKLNAAIVGMSDDEIEDRLPDILEFSELGEFINKKVKTYSSGMYIRLAFSVVINMKPDILVIDEALAVGDSRFQRKCFRKLDELRNAGTTILFVTHATDTVIAHCDRGLFVEQGRIVSIGDPKEVVNNYLESLFKGSSLRAREEAGQKAQASVLNAETISEDPESDGCRLRPTYNDTEYEWGTGDARIYDYLILNRDGKALSGVVESGERISVICAVYFTRPQRNVVYGLTIKTVDGTTVFGTNTERSKVSTNDPAAGDTLYVRFDIALDLVSAEYFFSLGVIARLDGEEEILHRRYDLFRIKVHDDYRAFGYAQLPVSITVTDRKDALAEC